MADEPENLTLLHLRAIDIKLDRLAEDVREIKTRVGILEQQYASVSTRIDNIDARLDRIENRLDPVPRHVPRVKQDRPGKGRPPGRSSSQVNDART